MAGRGRGATLPAWMTAGGADAVAVASVHNGASVAQPTASAGQFDDYNRQPPPRAEAYVPQANHAPPCYAVGSAPPRQEYDPRDRGHNADYRGRDDGRPAPRERSTRSRSRSK